VGVSCLSAVVLGSRSDHGYARRSDKQITFEWINCKFVRIRTKCVPTHGMEVKVPYWEVLTSGPYDLTSNAIFLGVWPYLSWGGGCI